MPRIRTIKPEFFRSRSLAKCSLPARITFAGLWCEADDHGRGIADARILKGALWPLEDGITPGDVEDHLEELAKTDHIRLYTIGEERYYEIVEWEKHQAAAYRRGTAVHPAPPEPPLASDPEPAEQEPHDDACKNVQDAPRAVLELGTGNMEQGTGNAPALRARKSDALWDAILECWQIDSAELTTTERDRLNKATKLLRDVGADPDDISRRRAIYRARYRDAADTPLAVAGRWAELAQGTNGRLPSGADAAQRQAKAMGLK